MLDMVGAAGLFYEQANYFSVQYNDMGGPNRNASLAKLNAYTYPRFRLGCWPLLHPGFPVEKCRKFVNCFPLWANRFTFCWADATLMSESIRLFPLTDYWWLYGAFTLFVLGMLALDLGVFHKNAHRVSLREATIWSVVWILLALVFNWGLYEYSLWKFSHEPRLLALPGFSPAAMANQVGLEFLTGYVIERSLSVDNIFIFAVVFSFFGIPQQYQHRVLFFGILGALVFRVIFIALGAALMQFQWVIWIFGVFLIITGVKLLFTSDKPLEPEKNPFIRLLRRLVPVTNTIEGKDFFVRKSGVLHATPLFVCLVFLEVTDIVFAIDSVPAIFAITREPLIVFTSNIFAILGLRAMFFLLADIMHRFHFLKYGLGIILVFVGLKMSWLNEAFGGKFPISWSLGIIGGILFLSIVISFAVPVRGHPAPLPSKATD
jgi:tellurite resistance protein TerC